MQEITTGQHQTIYVAVMEAERCTWTAVGRTEREALEALEQGWDASPYYGPDAYLTALPAEALREEYGVQVSALQVGQCARDGGPIPVDLPGIRPAGERA